MTTHEIMELGFLKESGYSTESYSNGIVKVLFNNGEVIGVYITGIKVDGLKEIDQLRYLCKKVNAVAA